MNPLISASLILILSAANASAQTVSQTEPKKKASTVIQAQPITLKEAARSTASPASRVLQPVVTDKAPTPPSVQLPGKRLAPIQVAPPINNQAPASTGPRVECQVPIDSVGSLRLDDSVMIVRDQRVEVRRRFVEREMPPLLVGRVVRYDEGAVTTGSTSSLSGLVFFYTGSMLDSLARTAENDLVFRSSGSVTGQILSCDDNCLFVRTKDRDLMKIPLDSVNYVRSERAFVFSIKGTKRTQDAGWQAQSISFQATSGQAPDLGERLVVGKPKDSFDLDDSDLVPQPRNLGPWGLMNDGGLVPPTSRPFSNWP